MTHHCTVVIGDECVVTTFPPFLSTWHRSLVTRNSRETRTRSSMTHRLAHVNQLARQFQNKFCRKFIDDHEQEFLHNIEFLAALVS